MTEARCIPVEELGRVRDLPADAPERRHAEHCPRCHARLLALAEFERESVLPAAAGASAAHARLDAAIDAMLGPDATPAPARRTRTPEPGWLARLFAPPAVRFAGAFATLALVAAAAWWFGRAPEPPAPATVRMERGGDAAAGAAHVRRVGGGWEVAWAPVADAQRYDVVVLDANLRELARVDAGAATRWRLERATLPEGLAPGTTLLVEIDAFTADGTATPSLPAPIRTE